MNQFAKDHFYAVCEWVTRYIKVAWLLIFLFAYTAFSKLNLFSYSAPFSWEKFKFIDLAAFQGAMFKSPVLRPYVTGLSYLIPFSELALCLLLLFNQTKKAGYYFSLLLLSLFTFYIIYILRAYPGHLPCVCGGVISLLSWPQHLLFNAFFILVTTRALYLSRKQHLSTLFRPAR